MPSLKTSLLGITAGLSLLSMSACGTHCTMMGNGPSLGLILSQEYQDDELPRKARSFVVVLEDEAQELGRFKCDWSPDLPKGEHEPCISQTGARGDYTISVSTSAAASGVQIEMTMSKHTPQGSEFDQTGPKQLNVRIEDQTTIHFEASYSPEYEKEEINGPGCGAIEAASLPASEFRFQVPKNP